jgi:hypothetical protein
VRAQAPAGALQLHAPDDIRAWSVYNPQDKRFLVWVTWSDIADATGTLITPPDTTGWTLGTPVNQMSTPIVGGVYNGDIDRTLVFQSTRTGQVGSNELILTYFIRKEENLSGSIRFDPGYVPGTVVPLPFRNQNNNTPLDFGLNIALPAGQVNDLGSFVVGLQDFEGFHIWRGTERDGSDLAVIGELSKEEAFKGAATGGNFVDSLYFYDVVPTLRTGQKWFPPFGADLDCLGTHIDLDLDADQYFWWDCNAVNGFTYYYDVTTFDRGYTVQSGTQGLTKYDNCTVQQGIPYACNADMQRVVIEVDTQADLYNVYVVPNPVRTGSSRLTTDNYHNFPDGLVRFVNLPPSCTIRIFTIAGDLVWVNDHVDGTGNVEWDVRNLENEDVASGVYMYRIEAEGGQVFGRIVVIR